MPWSLHKNAGTLRPTPNALTNAFSPSRTVSSTVIDAHGVMTDSVLNCETVEHFSAEHDVDSRYDKALIRSEDRWALFHRRRTRNGLLVALTFALSLYNLNEVSRGTTTLVIAHRLSTVVHADEIILLDRGEIKERGAHAALLPGNGAYSAMWRAQQQDDQGDKITSIA